MKNSLEPCTKEPTTHSSCHLPSQVDGAKQLKCLHILDAQADFTEWAHV